jgi:hypothetical protein
MKARAAMAIPRASRLGHNTGVTSLQIDHHTVAAISISGSCLDVLGSVYLAYDLLGGQRGPLRWLTRAVTYSIVFGLGYGLGLGAFFGLVAGVSTGITISFEFNRAARGLKHFSLAWESVFSAIRGVAFGVGLYKIVGLEFAIVFTVLVTMGTIWGYASNLRPAMDYLAARRSRITRRQFFAAALRTVAYTAAALLCSALVHRFSSEWTLAIRVGLVTGLVTAVGAMVNPFIEYYADNLPERRLGAFGIGLIFFGFALQSLQYWLALLDVHLT